MGTEFKTSAENGNLKSLQMQSSQFRKDPTSPANDR